MPTSSPTPPTNRAARRIALSPPHQICLSCQHANVAILRGQLRIFCGQQHRQADAQCADYQTNGNRALLNAIQQRIRDTQLKYRVSFNNNQPDCLNCLQNCCTTPFLNRTPFYPEDAIYYLLRDLPIPQIPAGIKHCMFFNQGCTLPGDLRPHVCIEYKCIYQNDQRIDLLGRLMHQTTIDLLAVATGDYRGWRGEYTIDERPALKRFGMVADQIFDRFDRAWQPEFPTLDLLIIYQANNL